MPMAEQNAKQLQPLVGVEVEYHLLGKDGAIAHEADSLLLQLQKAHPKIDFKKECARSMLEIANFPHLSVPNTIESAIDATQLLIEAAGKQGLRIYPFATYPGAFVPRMRDDAHYRIKNRIFGEERFLIAGRCAGYHCHFSLPKEAFDQKTHELRIIGDRRIEQIVANLYNMAVALDPVLAVLMQSSPFYQGQLLGKDSRVIVYRGDPPLKYPDGLYANHIEFGGHLPYVKDYNDLYFTISGLHKNWNSLVQGVLEGGETAPPYSLHKTMWNPHRVNAYGTLELRGMDITLPSLLASAAQVAKFAFQAVQLNGLEIVPGGTGDTEPFTTEGNKLHVPSFGIVNKILQPEGAYNGLQSGAVHEYVARFFRFLNPFVRERREHVLAPFRQMIEERRTVSDAIIAEAEKRGYKAGTPLPQELAQALALWGADWLARDLEETKKRLHPG